MKKLLFIALLSAGALKADCCCDSVQKELEQKIKQTSVEITEIMQIDPCQGWRAIGRCEGMAKAVELIQIQQYGVILHVK